LIKEEIKSIYKIFKDLDKKTVAIFIIVAVLQTVSWYFTSRRFFREYLFLNFEDYSDPYLIEFMYWFIGDFFTLFILSVLVIKFGFRERLSDYGLKIGDYKTGLTFSLVFLFVMVILIWFVSATPDFANMYPHLQSTKINWKTLLIYESGMFFYMFAWEFIWRGFMLFGLEKKFGWYSVFIQMIPFVILHNGKPFLETFGAIFGGIALGIIALRTRSIYYCILIHLGVMYSIDLISVLRSRSNDFGIGIESIINLLKQIL